MVAVDTNILIYAHRAEMEWHAAAQSALARLAHGRAPWAIPWPCVHEFLSVVTNPRAFQMPTPIEQALRQVEFWIESPGLRLLGELPAHWSELTALLRNGKVRGAMVHDARIAALCLEHGVDELWTADRDFSRMAGLKTHNPLLGAG